MTRVAVDLIDSLAPMVETRVREGTIEIRRRSEND